MELKKPLVAYVAVVALVWCGVPQSGWAQQTASPPASTQAAQNPGDDQQPDSPAGTQPAPQPQSAGNDTLPAAPEPQTAQPPQQPVGTAAAESPNVSGVAASQPAGAAIAPAKQRRVRTLVLKIGAIVGAGVAVGTVVALTSATPSKPPGAR